MFVKLISTTAVIAAMVSPALAGDFAGRGRSSQAYVQNQRGYGPGEVVAGAVAGAIGTAAAIATAPLRYGYPAESNGYYDSNAYYDGPYEPYGSGPYQTYNNDERYEGYRDVRPVYRGGPMNDPNGPICQPGTVVQLANGRPYLCQ